MDKLNKDLAQLELGKGELECGAGDSDLVASASSQKSGAIDKVLGLGPSDNSKPNEISKQKQNDEVRNLFEKSLNKKTNMYSADPVPLASPWTFWIDKTKRGVSAREYEASVKQIHTAFTVLSFWEVYNNIPTPKYLEVGASLHMMRDCRKPMWEEASNCSGGTFRFCVKKKDTWKIWKEILVAAAGEQFNEFMGKGDEVVGISVSVREGHDMILVWNSNAKEAFKAKIFECIELLMPDTMIQNQYYIPNCAHMEFDWSRAQLQTKKRNQ